MKTITMRFAFEKHTKNCFAFQEVDANGTKLENADANVGSIYIKKRVCGSTPKALLVTIQIEE